MTLTSGCVPLSTRRHARQLPHPKGKVSSAVPRFSHKRPQARERAQVSRPTPVGPTNNKPWARRSAVTAARSAATARSWPMTTSFAGVVRDRTPLVKPHRAVRKGGNTRPQTASAPLEPSPPSDEVESTPGSLVLSQIPLTTTGGRPGKTQRGREKMKNPQRKPTLGHSCVNSSTRTIRVTQLRNSVPKEKRQKTRSPQGSKSPRSVIHNPVENLGKSIGDDDEIGSTWGGCNRRSRRRVIRATPMCWNASTTNRLRTTIALSVAVVRVVERSKPPPRKDSQDPSGFVSKEHGQGKPVDLLIDQLLKSERGRNRRALSLRALNPAGSASSG